MNGFEHFWQQGDAVIKAVALLLLLMSVSAWVLILWKSWLLRRVRADISRAVASFWAAPDLQAGQAQLLAFDRSGVLTPLLQAATTASGPATLASSSSAASQLTRRLRDALHAVLSQLQWGQVLLASIGSTAPFIGLFGTVWGIYHALVGISTAGTLSIERVSGPVGEALIMTAIGLAVAVPAVMGYNWLIRRNKAMMDQVRGFGANVHAVLIGRRP